MRVDHDPMSTLQDPLHPHHSVKFPEYDSQVRLPSVVPQVLSDGRHLPVVLRRPADIDTLEPRKLLQIAKLPIPRLRKIDAEGSDGGLLSWQKRVQPAVDKMRPHTKRIEREGQEFCFVVDQFADTEQLAVRLAWAIFDCADRLVLGDVDAVFFTA